MLRLAIALFLVFAAGGVGPAAQTKIDAAGNARPEIYPPPLTPALPQTQVAEEATAGPPFLQPYVRAGKAARGAKAEWRPDIGLPDEDGKGRFGLLLQAGESASGAEVGARILGVKGLASLGKEVSFDYRNGGTCTRNAPALVISRNDGKRDVYGCADGKRSPARQDPEGWTNVSIPIAPFPPGVTITDLHILFDIPTKSIVIDNFRGFTWVIGWPGLSLYVADTNNHRIVRVDNWIDSGWIANWTTLGSQGSGVNQFSTPEGIFVDRLGRIYVADTGNHRVVRMNDMTGAGWTVLGGTCGLGVNQFCYPSSVFVDAAGRIYVAEASAHALAYHFVPNNRVIRVNDMSGAGWVAIGSAGGGSNQFLGPTGIYLDGAWRIYVADLFNQRVVRMDDMNGSGWSIAQATPSCLIRQMSGVFVNINIYLADGDLTRMNDISGIGCVTFYDNPAHDVHSVAVDTWGRIYFSEWFFDHRISRMRDMAGLGRVTLGSYGSGYREFNSPRGIHIEGREPSPMPFR